MDIATERAADEPAGQPGFSPFAKIGTVVQQPPPPAAPQAQAGDWVLPVLAAVVGFACIVALLRRGLG
jgi:hypothetical protein